MSSSLIPRDNGSYNSLDYWDKRYESCGQNESQSYDWLVDYSNVKHIIEKTVPKWASILMLGCGNSLLSEEMFADGYQHIHNIDYSSAVIKQMSTHCDKCLRMKWSVMDCLDLTFSDQTFDIVIEKATIDAFLSEEKNPWDISPQNITKLSSVFKEAYRVLKNGGQFLSISFYAPHFRYPLYNKCTENWPKNSRLQMKAIHELENTFHYYCYQLIKSPDKTIEFEPNLYEPPKMISGLDINQSTHNSDNIRGDETRVEERDSYLFDINL